MIRAFLAGAAALALSFGVAYTAATPGPIRFERVEGPPFVLNNSPTAEKYEPETMTGGLAVFDYNNDGRPDIFFANGAELPAERKTGPQYWNRLYRNDGNWKFTDVTSEAGVAGEGFAFGATAGDFDGDGNIDLFVPAIPASHLYRNQGNGTFEDVTVRSGIKTGLWPVAAGWLDYDNDGLPDLFVVNYLNWSVTNNPWCGDKVRNLRVYCHPNQFRPTPNQLFRNRGDGTFEDVSASSGIANHPGKGMSVSFGDYDGDGYTDIFVTNDVMPNFLFHNLGNGTFKEVAFEAGVALPEHGRAVSSMGTDFRDYDNDGRPDIIFVALAGESFPLFRNSGKGAFEEVTTPSRIGSIAARISGWSPLVADFDNDGLKDVFVACGHVNDLIDKTSADRYRLPNLMLRNKDGRTFEDATPRPMKEDVHAHRGAAAVDLDGDGLLDVVVTALGERAEFWRNTTPGAGSWLDVRLPAGKRTALGATVNVMGQTNQFTAAAGYSSSNLVPVHFGLGSRNGPFDVEIKWPGGPVHRVKVESPGRMIAPNYPK